MAEDEISGATNLIPLDVVNLRSARCNWRYETITHCRRRQDHATSTYTTMLTQKWNLAPLTKHETLNADNFKKKMTCLLILKR